MKTTKNLFLLLTILSLFSCSGDDDNNSEIQQECNCYYEVYEGGQLQDNWTIPSDTTDCTLDGSLQWFPGVGPNDDYYKKLKCQAAE